MKEVTHNVDLGKIEEYPSYCCDSKSSDKKKMKKRKYYPSAYLSNIDGLPPLAQKGTITFEYEIKNVNLNKNEEGKVSGSMDLRLKKLISTTPSGGESEDTGDAIEKMLESISSDTESKTSKPEVEDEDDEA